MAGLASLNIKIGAQIEGFQNALKTIEKDLRKLSSNLQSAGSTLTQALTVPLAGAGAAALSTAAKYETLRVSLSTLLGSAEKGAEAFDRLAEFAAKTPFQLEDVAAGAKQLLAFGLNIDEVYDSLSFLGDIAGATGSNLQDLTLIFGQARSIGAAYTEDLRQLAQRGVPVFDLLSQKTGLTGDALRKFIEQGKVTFPLLQELLKSTAQEGGVFFGGMEAQSKTLSGVFSTFKDNVSLALARIGDAIANAIDLRKVMGQLSDAIARAADWFGKLSPGMQKIIVIAAGVAAALGPVLFVIGKLIAVGPVLVTGLKAIGAAFTFMTGPVGLAIAAIGLLVAGVVYAYNKFEGFRRLINGLGAAIIEIIKIFKEAGAAFIEGFSNLKEGDFKKAGENFKKAFTAGIPTEFARQYGKRVKDAFTDGFADDTNYLKKVQKEFAAATSGAGVKPLALPTAPTPPGGGGTGTRRTTTTDVVAPLPTLKLFNEGLLTAFANSKGLESSLTAIKVITGEIDPAQIQFEGADASAKLFEQSITGVYERVKAAAEPVKSSIKSIAETLKGSLDGALAFIEDNVLPAISSFTAVIDASLNARGAAIDAYYNKEKARIDASVMSEQQKANAIAALDKETDRRKRKLARDQAIRDKAVGLVTAIINTAQGVSKALSTANIPLAAIIGALGAVQVGVIASQKIPALARGGLVTSEQLVTVGDNPSGKEAIIPFERMGEFLSMAGGGAVRVTGLFEVKGSDLVLVLDRAKQEQARIR